MNETKIEIMPICEDGTLTLSPELLPREWTSPVWVLWEPEEAYLTLFPAMPEASTPCARRISQSTPVPQAKSIAVLGRKEMDAIHCSSCSPKASG